MRANIWSGLDYHETVKQIFLMARMFREDLKGVFPNNNVWALYDFVRSLDYKDDPLDAEVVSRPKYTMRKDWHGPRDCDDKTLIFGAWAELNGIRWRVVCAGSSPNPEENPHHIYPELLIGGNWLTCDATYPQCRIGELLYRETFREVYSP